MRARAEQDDPGEGLRDQRRAEGRRDGHTSLAVNLGRVCRKEQRHAGYRRP